MQVSRSLENKLKIRKLKPLQETVEDVRQVLLCNLPQSLHTRINEKIDALNFDIKYDGTSSEYRYEDNTIYINVDYVDHFDMLLHEIMHAVGTELNSPKINIGLNKREITKFDNETFLYSNFGFGANEGLNQHYTEKFCQTKNDEIYVYNSYSFCANIMAQVEKLAGKKETMYSHFAGYGLSLLIKTLVDKCDLPNENKAMKLFLQLDEYQNIALGYRAFGVEYNPDSRLVLCDAYKTLITMALYKARAQNKDIYLSDIITNEHLSKESFAYLTSYMLKELTEYFYKEKEHLFANNEKKFVGVEAKSFMYYSKILFARYYETNSIDGIDIPEEIKCGEFYAYMLMNCRFYDENSSPKGIYTSDFAKHLSVCLFDKSKHLMPDYQKEKIQLIKHYLSSRNVVRSGAEIDDDYFIECCSDIDFNKYLIETMPDYYKSIFDLICDETKKNIPFMKYVLTNVFTSYMERYKLAKKLPKELFENQEIASFFKININGNEKDLTK